MLLPMPNKKENIRAIITFLIVFILAVTSFFLLWQYRLGNKSRVVEYRPYDKIAKYGPYDEIHVFSILDEGFAISYKKEGNNYLRINDKIYGPYSLPVLDFAIDKNQFIFSYDKNRYTYITLDNKKNLEVLPPGSMIGKINLSNGHFGFTYLDPKNSLWYVNVDNKIYGPYDVVPFFCLALDQGRFGFSYRKLVTKQSPEHMLWPKHMLWYENINNQIYGPYDVALCPVIFNDNFGFGYGVVKNRKYQYYININDHVYGPYKDLLNIAFSDKNFAFGYVTENDQIYFNINNKLYGPYKLNTAPALLTLSKLSKSKIILSNNNFGFLYPDKNKWHININGIIDQAYEDIDGFHMSGNNFGFVYKDHGKWYMNINGQIYGPYENYYEGSFSLSAKNFGFICKKDDKFYVVIGVIR